MVTVNMHKSNNLRQCRTLQTFKPFKLLFPQRGTRNIERGTLQTFKPFKPFKLLLPQRRTQNTEH